MRILIGCDMYYPQASGAAYYSYRLSVELAKAGDTVVVIAPSLEFKDSGEDIEGVHVYRLKSLPILVNKAARMSPAPIMRSKIHKIIEDFQPDVVHVQSHFLIGKTSAEEARSLGIAVVGTNHFMPENLVHYLHLPEFAERQIIKLGWRMFKDVYNHVDIVTTPTETAAKLLKKVGFTKKVLAISCGIDTKKYNPKNNGEYLKKKYKIPSGVPIVLYIGRLDKEKNVDTIIRAVTILLKKQKVHLVLGGKGTLSGSLKELAEELGVSKHVTFTGYVPDRDIPNLYAIGDVFVAAGSAELQCLSALEALATGIPLVVADAVALPELVPGNKNGYKFALRNYHDLADKIEKIISDKKLAAQMKKEGLKLAKKHEIKETIKETKRVYTDLLSRRRKKNTKETFSLKRLIGLGVFEALAATIKWWLYI